AKWVCRVPALLYTQEPLSAQCAVMVSKSTVRLVKLLVASAELSTRHTIGKTPWLPVTATGLGIPWAHQLSMGIGIHSPSICGIHQRDLLAGQTNRIPLSHESKTGSSQTSCCSFGSGLGIHLETSPLTHKTPLHFCTK